MITQEKISLVKSISIIDWLRSQGIEPVNKVSGQYIYFSLFSDEKTPSFFIHENKNVWNDFSVDDRGDIIRLVQKVKGCSFNEAIEVLVKYSPLPLEATFSFSGQKYIDSNSSVEIKKLKPLQNRALLAYLQSRAIPIGIASTFLQEAYYTTNGSQRKNGMNYFALAFKNDLNGYELRNSELKISASPKWFTSFIVPDSSQICIFEGFFDFLSALVYFNRQAPLFSTIVLNSLSLLKEVNPIIERYDRVVVFFDNDKAGITAIEKLKKIQHKNIIDCSTIYMGFKDFNEFVIKYVRIIK